jgi:hypothetical protein
MAMLADVIFSSKSECLQELAKTVGTYPPRSPITPWWELMQQEWGSPYKALMRAAEWYEPENAVTGQKPKWLDAFDAWYVEVINTPHCRMPDRPDYFGFTVRTEAFTYADDADDDEFDREAYDNAWYKD